MRERRKRSWLSIRLRTLLLLTLASGCGLGLIGREVRQAQRRELAAKDLARAASNIEVEYCDFWGRTLDSPPPAWQRRLLGEHYFQRLTAVVITRPDELPEQGRLLAELRHLKSFELRAFSRTFTDAHAEHLRPLRNLEDVSFYRAPVSDAAVACLSPSNPLRSLKLDYTLVTDASLERLAQFPTLETLDLSHTLVTDEGLRHLARLPRLKNLNLAQVMVSDEGVKSLALCRNLEHLYLSELPLTAEAFAAVARFPRLKQLVLGRGSLYRGARLERLSEPAGQEGAVAAMGPPNVFWAIGREHAPRNTPYLRWLLEHGADPNARLGGLSAAAVLAGRGALEPLGVLLEFGAELNPDRRASYRTPLAAAAERGQEATVRFLLARGADPNLPQAPALVHAAYGHKIGTIKILAAHGADVDLANPQGATPLLAALSDNETVKTLLELGADPNRADAEGNTPLHLAALANKLEMAKILLRHGADPTLQNKHGQTPYDIAQTQRRRFRALPELAEILKP